MPLKKPKTVKKLNSLLMNTDRDVRGAYKLFSRPKVRAALEGMGLNDRSSANFKIPRKNFSVTAKAMAKTQSLTASLKNLTNYLSLLKRASNTIGAIEDKLKRLDDVVNESRGLIESVEYVRYEQEMRVTRLA